jgi:hypothetical protein
MSDLVVSHSNKAGFFSCCSIRLFNIVKCIHEKGSLPHTIDTTDMFHKAKTINDESDITYEFFKHYSTINIGSNSVPEFKSNYQFSKDIDYKTLCALVNKYFSPSKQIQSLVEYLENRYNITDYNNICALFYRGNDKITETPLCDYNQMIEKANILLKQNPNVQFFIQSDETEFIETMKNAFPTNSFYMKEEIKHVNKNDAIVVDDINQSLTPLFTRFYLAITIIMSKCNYVVCTSGNCSLWIMLYRKNANNVHQFLDNEWL